MVVIIFFHRDEDKNYDIYSKTLSLREFSKIINDAKPHQSFVLRFKKRILKKRLINFCYYTEFSKEQEKRFKQRLFVVKQCV